jgi:hypothetical protein
MLTTSYKFTRGKYLDSLSIYVTIRKLVCPFLSRTRSNLYIMAYLHLGAFILRMHDHLWFWDAVCCRDVVSGAEVALYYSFRGDSGDSEQNTGLERMKVFSFPARD